MYEMLIGYPPFYSDEPMATCRKVNSWIMLCHLSSSAFQISPAVGCCVQIVNWRSHLKFPDEVRLSAEAKDLISKLLCDVEHRLGTKGAHEIKVRMPMHYFCLAVLNAMTLNFNGLPCCAGTFLV